MVSLRYGKEECKEEEEKLQYMVQQKLTQQKKTFMRSGNSLLYLSPSIPLTPPSHIFIPISEMPPRNREFSA